MIPPEEITPLFLVRKNKRCGVPWFQKQILEEIGFRMGENQKVGKGTLCRVCRLTLHRVQLAS